MGLLTVVLLQPYQDVFPDLFKLLRHFVSWKRSFFCCKTHLRRKGYLYLLVISMETKDGDVEAVTGEYMFL